MISTETIEELKDKIDDILKDSEKKVIVFIDDIDRLDKNEIHAVFRLVKLTADFYKTTYILSFDEKMVAAAIGERFGKGDKESGQNFLEKIIQVPLTLPVAQPKALQQFCFDIINSVFRVIKIELSETDGKRFSSQFQSNILLRLNTPRLAIRYGNTISFSIPLLFGEVNIDDLLLIEAIKIFYPDHYDFIKLNPDFFIGSFKEMMHERRDNKKVDLLNKHLDNLGTGLSVKEKECIKTLLISLFPRLNEVYYNHVYTNRIETQLYKKMQIASPKHFNRFFSYTVIKGDLSDIVFKTFIQQLPQKSIQEVAESIKELIEQSSPDNFLIQLRIFEEEYPWAVSKKIANGIVVNTQIFPKHEQQFLMRFESPYGQSQILISQLIKKHKPLEEGLNLIKELISNSKLSENAYDLVNWFTYDEKDPFFSQEQLLELDDMLIRKALREAGDVSVFNKFEDTIQSLIPSWAKLNHNELLNYTKNFIKKNSNEAINLLRTFTPTGWSSLFPKPFKRDFTEEQYKMFTSIFDKDYFSDEILKCFDIKEIQSEDVIWVGREKNTQTDLNIVRQFFYWKNREIAPSESEQ